MHICHLLVRFWCKYPALFYGIILLLGFYAFFYGFASVSVPLFTLGIPFLIAIYHRQRFLWKPFCLGLALFCTCWSYAHFYYKIPSLPKEGIGGVALLSIQSIQIQRAFFGAKWLYSCQLKSFYAEADPTECLARHIHCFLSFPQQAEIQRPPADCDYLVTGKLMQTDQGFYILKISTLSPWKIVRKHVGRVESRYRWKKSLQSWINSQFSNPLNAIFLGGLATGEFDDRWLRGEFARFGLQHIMAISGFHFAIITAILSLLLRLFFSRKLSAALLLLLISGYAFFLGANPSIMRAWIMCSLVMIGVLIEKNAPSLNSLGIALIGVTLYDPLFCQTIGFQFSFLTTAAILLLYGPLDSYLGSILTKRALSEVIEMNAINQHGYCVLAFFKQGLALMAAVNLLALPLTLYYFQQFPWMSLLYNLFFPFLISIALCLLICGFLLSWIPFIGTLIHQLNGAYTSLVLKFTYGLPLSLDSYLRVEPFSSKLLISYFTCLIFIGIIKHENNRESNQEIFI